MDIYLNYCAGKKINI